MIFFTIENYEWWHENRFPLEHFEKLEEAIEKVCPAAIVDLAGGTPSVQVTTLEELNRVLPVFLSFTTV